MALYIPHSIFHLARLLYVRPETFGPYYVNVLLLVILQNKKMRVTYIKIIFLYFVITIYPTMHLLQNRDKIR